MATSNFRTIQTNFTEGVQFTKNYIPNATFQNGSVNGWNLFTTSLSGGLPTGALTLGSAASITTFSVTTTTPISGSHSMQVGSSAAWSAGQGVITDAFTIEREDLGKPVAFSLSFEAITNSTNANWSGILGSQTFAIYVYDVTNSSWLQPSGFLGMNQNSGVGQVMGSFQTSFTSGQQYRLAIIALQASSGAITINVDNVFLGKQISTVGTPITDFVEFSPTINWTGGYTTSGYYRRIGDSIDVSVKISITGAPIANSELLVYLPSGLTIDTTKLVSPAQGNAPVYGDAVGYDNSTTNRYLFRCQYWTTTSVKLFYQSSSTGQETAVSTSLPPTWATSDTINVRFQVPVVGFSSSVQMSNATDTRVVAATVSGTPAAWSANGIVIFPSISTDSHSAYSTSTGRYTVPVTGWYQMSAWVGTNNYPNNISIYRDGVQTSIIGAGYGAVSGGAPGASGSGLVYANAGQLLDIRSNTAGGTTTASYLSINRLSGPSAIASSETVAAFGQTTAGLSIPNATWTTVTTPTIVDSTHGALSTGGVFTAPVSGRYFVAGIVNFNSNASGYRGIRIRKNSGDTGLGILSPAVSGDFSSCSCSGYLNLNAGDTVIMQAVQTSGGSISLVTSTALSSNISIIREGN